MSKLVIGSVSAKQMCDAGMGQSSKPYRRLGAGICSLNELQRRIPQGSLKLFALQPGGLLTKEYSCHMRRKEALQRLVDSSRVVK